MRTRWLEWAGIAYAWVIFIPGYPRLDLRWQEAILFSLPALYMVRQDRELNNFGRILGE